MTKTPRTRTTTPSEARTRARSAVAYLEVADLALTENDVAMKGVAAGVAVLAGIAASDAICARRLGEIHRGRDHRGAAELLRTATPDGQTLVASFTRLIDLKDEAHYGLVNVAPSKAAQAVRWARTLVSRALEEIER